MNVTRIFTLPICLVALIVMEHNARAVWGTGIYTCYEEYECISDPRCAYDVECCPTGRSQQVQDDCGSYRGWHYDSNTKLCVRDAITSSDEKGTYTQYYGTCSPRVRYVPCYNFSSSPQGLTGCISCDDYGY